MKRSLLILCVLCTLVACTKNSVDFGYSPLEPKAGEKIQFTNVSTRGEEWAWDFGDATSSEVKNPEKTYKQPGTYTVTLKVDNKSSWTKTKSITVYDTVPSFECSVAGADSLGIDIFTEVTMSALVYNPYNYTLTYAWQITGAKYELLSAADAETLKFCILHSDQGKVSVTMTVTMSGYTRTVEKSYKVNDVKASALLLMDKDSVYSRQRIFGSRAEEVTPLTYDEGKQLLDEAQDTIQVYNGNTFRLADFQTVIEDILGFRIASRKIYYRTMKGLFVATIDGAYPEQITDEMVNAICTDAVNNRLYWATDDAVFYMPLIGSENNKFTTNPVVLNSVPAVIKLAIDPVER